MEYDLLSVAIAAALELWAVAQTPKTDSFNYFCQAPAWIVSVFPPKMASILAQILILIFVARVSLTLALALALAQQTLNVQQQAIQQQGVSCPNCGTMQVQISNFLAETCTIQTFWRLQEVSDIAIPNKETLQASLLKSCNAILFGPLFTSSNFTNEELLSISSSNNYNHQNAFARLRTYLCFRVCAFSAASIRRCYEIETQANVEGVRADESLAMFRLKLVQTNQQDQAFDFNVFPEATNSSSNASQQFANYESQFCKSGILIQT